jgi:Tfp pilus assembly protein PilN
MLIQLVIFYFVFSHKAEELDTITQDNSNKASAIEQLKKQVADVEKLTTEKGLVEEQIGVLDQLQVGRAGPVRVLDEIQLILSKPRNDLDRLTYDKRGWNAQWESERLWFNDMSENKGVFSLSGGARSSDDVAEFLQRLSTSLFFEDVRLLSVDQQEDKAAKFSFVRFEIKGKITYILLPATKPAAGAAPPAGGAPPAGAPPATP